MSKSANLPAETFDSAWNEATAATPAWKQEVNQRLAAHRNRRGAQDGAESKTAETSRPASGKAAEAAARVAARYANAPSYSQILAGEARAAVRAAGAAAEAALNAQAAAEAVLAGLESSRFAGRWEPAEEEPVESSTVLTVEVKERASEPAAEFTAVPATTGRWLDEPPAAQIPVQSRWEETLPVPETGRDVWSEMRVHPNPEPVPVFGPGLKKNSSQEYVQNLEESELFPENSYDSDPVGSATVEPVEHLPANLIEFPRELVAPRKARPRLAEGPLYDESREHSQLNIFEVDPEQLAPPVCLYDVGIAPPGWASIELDAHRDRPATAVVGYAEQVYADTAGIQAASYAEPVEMATAVEDWPAEVVSQPAEGLTATENRLQASVAERPVAPPVELLVARLSDRSLAAVVDGALVTLAFLAAAVVVIASTAHPPTGRIALIASVCGLAIFGLLYQFLFLSYAEEGTPGMRYARIALCTFDDENPTRRQMRMRIPALVLSALPAGLGLMWSIFDGDHLGWHDRLTRTYQRKY